MALGLGLQQGFIQEIAAGSYRSHRLISCGEYMGSGTLSSEKNIINLGYVACVSS